ncbi:hypothetical protein BDA99DRAFT_496495 [Phascolomyces articulosus]|uniref:Uncharacterized protein n=1 Tax=Phascolomyces articulosus TaxID=60185 RepID=A0AAD5KN70_9FUNG|nr:hypothetical protein BDA99DRAFT_496495 [Phascolomyces articulosus]
MILYKNKYASRYYNSKYINNIILLGAILYSLFDDNIIIYHVGIYLIWGFYHLVVHPYH